MSRDFQLYVKSYPSIVSKLYRMNVLTNGRFDKPPKRGWITPRNCSGGSGTLSLYVRRRIDEPAKVADDQ